MPVYDNLRQLSIQPYKGNTFVAFLDLSGFKKLMLKNRRKAEKSLGRFYNTIYSVGRDYNYYRTANNLLEVISIVVSDCSVIFPIIKNTKNKEMRKSRNINGLQSILTFIRHVNTQLFEIQMQLDDPLLTTCSIAFGEFKYENRIGLRQVRKNFFLGKAYLNAFFDSETESPKIRPGQCRLVKNDLDFLSGLEKTEGSVFSFLQPSRKHYYFYWMLTTPKTLYNFKIDYKDACKIRGQDKYDRIKNVIRRYLRNT